MQLALLSVGFVLTALGFLSNARAETTRCTEITSVPIVIEESGIYCLKGNLSTDITAGTAIRINSNNVVIDLNGWRLGGLQAGPTTSTTGISAFRKRNITIKNGTIRGFRDGVRLYALESSQTTDSSGHLIENILADANTRRGIFLAGDHSRILNNAVINMGGSINVTDPYGIWIDFGSGNVISGNFISDLNGINSSTGIRVFDSQDSLISNNTITNLESGGFSSNGINLTTGSERITISKNTIIKTDGTAIFVTGGRDIACLNNLAFIGQVENPSPGNTQNIRCETEVGNIEF